LLFLWGAGGLVYVSDRVGEHDFSLLRRLVLPDGSVLRCRQPGRPSPDCLFRDVSRDKQTVLKVGLRGCGEHCGAQRYCGC
jgi:raffinose synthase